MAKSTMTPFDGEAFTRAVIATVIEGVRLATEKAMESAVEDAPVRAVFFKGSSRRRRGLRRRAMSLAEANSEDYIRRKMHGRMTLAQQADRPLRLTQPGAWTGGRKFGPEPYLRLASTRKGNPNAFAPFVIRPGLTRADIKEFQAFRAERVAVLGTLPLSKDELAMEPEPEVRGGRELNKAGKLKLPAARKALDARGRYDLRTGRATSHGKGGDMLGGTLRRAIRMQQPTMVGSVIKARVLSPVYYSQYQEFGTRHNRATPYMRPAIAKMHATYRRDMVRAINSLHWR